MDPADLLFLHSTLAATIRAQQAQIDRLEAMVEQLTAEQKADG